MDIDDDVIDLSQVRDDFDLGYTKNNQNLFGNLSNSTSQFQFNDNSNNNNNRSLTFFQNGINKNDKSIINNNPSNIQLPFNSMDDESDTEILIPLENDNEELITDVQPSFSLERGEEDTTIEIELESYEKEKYSWFLNFLEIVGNKSTFSQKENELNILDNNLLKNDLNLETLSPLKISDNSYDKKDFHSNNTEKLILNSSSVLEQNNKYKNSSDTKSVVEKNKFKLITERSFPFNENLALISKNLNDKNSKTISGNDNKLNNLYESITKERNNNINNDIFDLLNNRPKTATPTIERSFENSETIRHSRSLILSNSNDSFSNENVLESKKSNSFSNDNSHSYEENKELRSIDKRRSLSSLSLTHFNLNDKRNSDINKKIDEIRERLKHNEKHDKSKINILNDTPFHFETKTDTKLEHNSNHDNLLSNLHLFSNDYKNINLNDDNNSDEANELLNSTSFNQLEISSKEEKRPPSKKKPFSLDSLKNLNKDSFSLNLNLSSTLSNSKNTTSLLHKSKCSSIPTFSQFYSNNKNQKDIKKSKNSFSLNIPKSASPTLEQQLANPSSTYRVAKYARLNNTKLPMPSKVPRKLYDEYLNLRNDSSNDILSTSKIKPVEPRKQAIPISKLRQPSKLRLRPNILNSSTHNNFSSN
ncbi:hypothetical protein H8356DRAFT_1272585 [Neocallimastix lanati (nom. inval.)]|nr:hypothetical protein H8356DRAFT_1272585 [Neocallimastix sp. JGI-2020a]